eukprot:12078640-Alexandrium_andersonii.AAC.1
MDLRRHDAQRIQPPRLDWLERSAVRTLERAFAVFRERLPQPTGGDPAQQGQVQLYQAPRGAGRQPRLE